MRLCDSNGNKFNGNYSELLWDKELNYYCKYEGGAGAQIREHEPKEIKNVKIMEFNDQLFWAKYCWLNKKGKDKREQATVRR